MTKMMAATPSALCGLWMMLVLVVGHFPSSPPDFAHSQVFWCCESIIVIFFRTLRDTKAFMSAVASRDDQGWSPSSLAFLIVVWCFLLHRFKASASAELYQLLHCLPLLCIVYTPLETLGRRTWSMDIGNMVLPFKYHQFQVSVKLTTGPTRMFIHYLSTAEKGMPNKTKVPIHPPILGYMILTFLIPYHSRDW